MHTNIVDRGYLEKIKKFISSGKEGVNLAQSILYTIALGKKLSSDLDKNPKVKQIVRGFRRYKFIRRVKEKNHDRYFLTPKGESKLRKILIDEVVIKTDKKWDGKWRVVVYDLPIRFKKAREAFRWKLKDLGFFQLQKSTWIYPYPCEGEILFVADFFGVRKHIEILEVNKILDESKLKTHFCLQ
ncbi:MAG: hypothetical protein Q8O46_03115 [bacterium]|nr:hypothetical protein [bacterium]